MERYITARGLLVPVVLRPPEYWSINARALEGVALVDSGASLSCITKYASTYLSLPKSSSRRIRGVHGPEFVASFGCEIDAFDLGKFEEIYPAVDGPDEGDPAPRIVAIIGRDVMQTLLLGWDGPRGMCAISRP
jgi:hypothetical protein